MNRKYSRGQGLVEYAILIALIAVGIVLTLNLFGVSLAEAYCSVANQVSRGEACKSTPLCEDDFSSDLEDWIPLEGNPGEVKNGSYCPSNYTRMLNACSTSVNVDDYVVSVDGATLASGWGYGVAFRLQDTPNGITGYMFQYDPGYYPGSFIFRKWVNGRELSPPIAVKKAPDYDWYGEAHNVTVAVKGDTFTAYVDGEEMLSVTDSAYPTGGAGLRTWDSTVVCFDGFSVLSLP